VLLFAFACGCGRQATAVASDEPIRRLVLLVIDGLDAVPGIPGGFESSGPMHVAYARLAEDLTRPLPDVPLELAESAVRAERLIMIVDSRMPDGFDGRDNISIQTGSASAGDSAGPVTEPPDLLTGVDLSGWRSLQDRQRTIQDLANRFGPDIIIVECSTSDADTALAVGTEWLEYISSNGGNLMIISPPREPWYRGWAVMAGEGFDPVPPTGMTPSGFLNTAALLAGLTPPLPLSAGVPALESIHQGGKIIP
jgi:hypothetical protein